MSVLRLAKKWEFPSIIDLVARRLKEVASLVDQIVFALDHDLPSIVGPAGAKLCSRGEPLTSAESRRLGLDAAHAIWTLRERFRGGQQAVSFSNTSREEKRVQSFFESAGLVRSSVSSPLRGRLDRRDSMEGIRSSSRSLSPPPRAPVRQY